MARSGDGRNLLRHGFAVSFLTRNGLVFNLETLKNKQGDYGDDCRCENHEPQYFGFVFGVQVAF